MKMVSTFEITKGFDRWLYLVDVELKSKLEEYGVKVHFACANEDETRVYDMFEIEDPSRVEAFLMDDPNEKQFKLNAKENGKSFIDLLTSQGNKVETIDGEMINSGFSEALESFLEATGEKHPFPLLGK